MLTIPQRLWRPTGDAGGPASSPAARAAVGRCAAVAQTCLDGHAATDPRGFDPHWGPRACAGPRARTRCSLLGQATICRLREAVVTASGPALLDLLTAAPGAGLCVGQTRCRGSLSEGDKRDSKRRAQFDTATSRQVCGRRPPTLLRSQRLGLGRGGGRFLSTRRALPCGRRHGRSLQRSLWDQPDNVFGKWRARVILGWDGLVASPWALPWWVQGTAVSGLTIDAQAASQCKPMASFPRGGAQNLRALSFTPKMQLSGSRADTGVGCCA